MTASPDLLRARRYLLGQASEEECAIIEQEYLEQDEAVDRIAAVEDDLIEDYLGGQLAPTERERFERVYLSIPAHRVRVETIRRLTGQAAQSAPRQSGRSSRIIRGPWLALAASLLIGAVAGLWIWSPVGSPEPGVVDRSPASPPGQIATGQPPPAPRIFALTMSPASVRSGSENPAIVIPQGTDVVVIRLEADAETRALVPRRASIQVVGGEQAWEGPVTPESEAPVGTVARLDVPAGSLPPNDYIVTLYGTDQSNVEREWVQYFLGVRAR